MNVTITKSGRTNSYGQALVVGTTYAVDDAFGRSLVDAGFATDTDQRLYRADNFEYSVSISAEQIAAPPAVLLADTISIFRLNVSPWTRYVSNGTILQALNGPGAGGVTSVNGQAGVVSLTAADVGATTAAAVVTYTQATYAPIAAGVTDGDKGDIIVSAANTVWSLDTSGVTAGTYINPTVVFNAQGRAILAFNGAGAPAIPVDFKDSALVATTANITLSGEQTLDGVLTSASRVLVKSQNNAAENGIYVSAAGAWSRSTDADANGEVTTGMLIYVESGTANGDQVFVLTTLGTIVVGTTALAFVAMALPFGLFVYKTVAGTTYTHVLADSQKRLLTTNAAAKTITIAPQGTVNSAVNTEIDVYNSGAGICTLAPGAAVTLNGPLIVPKGGLAKLKKRANPNTWDISIIIPTLPEFALTDGANIALDASNGNEYRVTLGGNRTLDNPTNMYDGQSINIRVTQDGTGSRTLAYGSKYKFPGGAPVLSTPASTKDYLCFKYNSTTDLLYGVLQKAFA